jgi:SAM-dependent MidA family methyltransferase
MDTEAGGALRRAIVATIEAAGPMPFARFMELCLYHPEHGYYTRGLGGGSGRDYVTSSGLHRAYGALVARQAAEMWRALGAPERFRFVEFGPGEGHFGCDMLRAAAGEGGFSRALEYVLVETSPALKTRQQERIGRFVAPPAEDAPRTGETRPAVRWADLEDLEREPRSTGCLFANEVLDAFPVHRVVGGGDGLREIHVDVEAGALVERALPLTDPGLAAYLETAAIRPEPGQEVDVQPGAARFVARAARLLARGWFLVVDYGYEAVDLYHPARRRGTLMAYHRHRAGERFLERPGEQDLTAHVDFTAVRRAAAESGLRAQGLTTQARFLLALGALEEFERGDLRERERLKDLVLPDRLGGAFRVLVLATPSAPDGLRGLSEPWRDTGAPAGTVSPRRGEVPALERAGTGETKRA